MAMTDKEKWIEFLRLQYPTSQELAEAFDDAEIDCFTDKDHFDAFNDLYLEYMNKKDLRYKVAE